MRNNRGFPPLGLACGWSDSVSAWIKSAVVPNVRGLAMPTGFAESLPTACPSSWCLPVCLSDRPRNPLNKSGTTAILCWNRAYLKRGLGQSNNLFRGFLGPATGERLRTLFDPRFPAKVVDVKQKEPSTHCSTCEFN